MSKYEALVNTFARKECKLLTTEHEYHHLTMHTQKSDRIKVRFIATCGHENTVTVSNFKQKASGVLCKDCIKAVIKQKHLLYQDTKDASSGLAQESMFIGKLTNIVSNVLQIYKTNEGCTADAIVRPLLSNEDSWLQLQIKTTRGVCHNLYSFSCRQKYHNHLIICHCIADNKYWLIPYEHISHLASKISIGLTSASYYSKYQVDESHLSQHILQYYYEAKKLFPINECMQPSTPERQTEHKFKLMREEKLPFLDFKMPAVDGSHHDFLINQFRVQEKVATKMKKKRDIYQVTINRTHCKPYLTGMNDFYWIHIPDIGFYVFPEFVFVEHGIVEDKPTNVKKRKSLTFNVNCGPEKWYSQYLFLYDLLDTILLQRFFNLTQQ